MAVNPWRGRIVREDGFRQRGEPARIERENLLHDHMALLRPAPIDGRASFGVCDPHALAESIPSPREHVALREGSIVQGIAVHIRTRPEFIMVRGVRQPADQLPFDLADGGCNRLPSFRVESVRARVSGIASVGSLSRSLRVVQEEIPSPQDEQLDRPILVDLGWDADRDGSRSSGHGRHGAVDRVRDACRAPVFRDPAIYMAPRESDRVG